MTDAQLVVYNDAGIEQVSLGGINLALVHKEVIPGPSSWSAISGPQAAGLHYSFSVTAVNPIVAVATSVAGVNGAVFSTVTNTGTNTWRIDLYGAASETTASSAGASVLSGAVNVYVFDEAPAPASGPGLVLYDSTGKCVFNALYPAVRVKQMLDDANNAHGYGTSLSVPSGSTYATIQRSNWGQQIIGSVNPTTGDRLSNEYRMGVSGGLSGAALSWGYGQSCFINGSIPLSHGSSGSVGTTYSSFGCTAVVGGTPTYIVDGVVIDVTNF